MDIYDYGPRSASVTPSAVIITLEPLNNESMGYWDSKFFSLLGGFHY